MIECMEAVMGAVFERAGFAAPPPPWPRMTFAEAVSRYGTDRPDTRFGLELHDLGEPLSRTEFKVFADVLAAGGVVRGINAGSRELPRSELDALTELAKQHGAKGLVWAFVQDGEQAWRSPIAKFLTPDGDRGDQREARGLARRAAAGRRRRGHHRGAGAQRAAAGAGAAFRPDRPHASRHPVGGRVPGVLVERRRTAMGLPAPSVHGADRGPRRPRELRLACLRPGPRRLRDRRGLDPHPSARGAGEGVRAARNRAGGGPGAVRVPARRAQVRRPSAWRDRDGDRQDRRGTGGARTRSAM